MYAMWRNGVSLVTSFTLMDEPFPYSPYQSGLYFVNGKPKPSRRSWPSIAARRAGGPRLPSTLRPGDRTRRQATRTRATKVLLPVAWRQVAPARAPGSWSPTDPADPAYDWTEVDARVRRAVAAGLDPLLTIVLAPGWATAPGGGKYIAGTYKPSATE